MRHDKTEYEFMAKSVNDHLARKYKGQNVGFMTFIFDYGDSGHIGFIASSRRIDSIRMITEWLAHAIPGLTRESMIEMLELLIEERWDNDTEG